MKWRKARERAGFASLTAPRTAEQVLAAAEERDALADVRDAAADKRDQEIDLAELLGAAVGEYGSDWPARRAAALDREHARQDRIAAHEDLKSLADRLVARDRSAQDDGLDRRVR